MDMNCGFTANLKYHISDRGHSHWHVTLLGRRRLLGDQPMLAPALEEERGQWSWSLTEEEGPVGQVLVTIESQHAHTISNGEH